MSVNPTESTPSRSQSAPVEGIKARRNQRVLLAVAKAFGVSRTLRDPETGVYRVPSAAELLLPTITSSQTAGTGRKWTREDYERAAQKRARHMRNYAASDALITGMLYHSLFEEFIMNQEEVE